MYCTANFLLVSLNLGSTADGSRMKTYRVAFAAPPQAIELTPTWISIEWPGPDGIAIARWSEGVWP